MKSTLGNLLLTLVAAGTGCAAASENTVRDRDIGACAELHRWYSPSIKEYPELEMQAKENLVWKSGVATDETTVCGSPFSFGYSGDPSTGLCPVYVVDQISSLEKAAIQAYLLREVATRIGERFQDDPSFSQRTIPPANSLFFGMYTITADCGSIYAVHRPILVYGYSEDRRVVCVQAVKFVGDVAFLGCEYPIAPEKCDRRYKDFNDKAPLHLINVPKMN